MKDKLWSLTVKSKAVDDLYKNLNWPTSTLLGVFFFPKYFITKFVIYSPQSKNNYE